MKQTINSVRDCTGRLCLDCTECAMGYNGDKSCSAGWHISQPRRGSCMRGAPLPELKEAMQKLRPLPLMGGDFHAEDC